jgi:hypothetical protein
MTFAHAKQILNGSRTVATVYFKGTTTDTLIAAFRPEAENAMNSVGVTKPYKELVGHFEAILFAKSDLIDIDRDVVGESLDGLFVMLAKEERKIQTNSAARVTDLLKEVFAKTGSS